MTTVQLTDPASGSTARVAPQVGFNCFEFRAMVGGRAVNVIDAVADFDSGQYRASSHGIPILFPFPNRIRAGRFTWNGTEHHLPPETAFYDRTGNAIHGFCHDRAWRVIANDGRSVTARFQLSVDAPDRRPLWPADFLLEARYRLSGTALRFDLTIRNPDTVPLPWGFGTHPYFHVPLAPDSRLGDCTVEAPVTQLWELDSSLPTGRRVPVPEEKDLADVPYIDLLKLDDVFTELEPTAGVVQALIVDEAAGLEVAELFPADFRELVAFPPPNRAAICLEPYTCTSDAINLQARGIDAGWRTLEPGGEFRTWIEIEARRIEA